ncbi:hypothetical protein [Nitrosomonas sp. Nm34]|uniref:hypothetical protein n=1 Tax=Nitrosomonas sp. Nm34 TaxID=1881055 RepID=UPI0008EA5EF1|nr:hypothetical protein [Nitrosomonas sp. Nm34]SFI31174.1 hypothetical protein SAMN05428978_100554 [Nitrosomonas sp. Nm34]
MRKSSLGARLRRLRFGYASVTPETRVVTQLRDFLAFPIHARERFLKIFHVMKNYFLHEFALQTMRNQRNRVTTGISAVTSA